MSKKIILQKATRVEGNANIQIEIEKGRIKTARFTVEDFRGFEKFTQGTAVETVPHLVSRICGLCCVAHQVAGYQAIEDALGIDVECSVNKLREVMVLAEWISSHSLSYFFLNMPDLIGVKNGIFDMMKKYPKIADDAFFLRRAGLEVVRILGGRAVHPVSLAIGGFETSPKQEDIETIRGIVSNIKTISENLILRAGEKNFAVEHIPFPKEHKVNFLNYERDLGSGQFNAYNREGEIVAHFGRDAFEEYVSEMRANWTFAKFPYLTHFGFPEGIVLVGPLSRIFGRDSIRNDPEIADFPLAERVANLSSLHIGDLDTLRLLEIYWSAKKIFKLIEEVDLSATEKMGYRESSGKGIGVVEAPRGILVHSYLINRGRIERIKLLVATQFNNAYINFILKDLAETHLQGDSLSKEGEAIIGRCIRTLDPCLSCATH